MKLDMNNLSKYDLTNAKAGDKVIVGHDNDYGHSVWRFNEATIKSVSPKRGDITLSNGSRYQKDGRKMGVGRWDLHYSDNFFEYTQGNIEVIGRYITSEKKANEIICWFRKIEKQGFKMLYDLPEDKINILHKTMTEIFQVSEDD
jgi:hypothetical protein